MSRTNETYVVAVGLNGVPGAYLLHHSERKVSQAANELLRNAAERYPMANVTRGRTVRMRYSDLKREIPGFHLAATCLDAGGLLTALAPREPYQQWVFDCEMQPTRKYTGRLPPPSAVYPQFRNPIGMRPKRARPEPPKPSPEQVQMLAAQIQQYLVQNKLDYDSGIYTQEQWRARGEQYGTDAVLTITTEGPLYDVLNFHGGASTYREEEKFRSFLEKLGYYYELGYAWSVHIYPINFAQSPQFNDA